MNLWRLIEKVKSNPQFSKAGMILCHNGVVRDTSRDGRKVSGLQVGVDHTRLDKIIETHKRRPGIVDIQVEIAENRKLEIGEDVMFLVVAGDIRENVIDCLRIVLVAIKTTVTQKTEYYQ